MGAESFEQLAWGKTAEEAFKKALASALYYHGHQGYSGSLAEKTSFTLIPLPEYKDPFDLARDMVRDGDERIDDKWGPAGCIEIPQALEEMAIKKGAIEQKKKEGEKLFLFFGWASA